MKKKATYDQEELEIIQAIEAGSLKPVTNVPKYIKSHRTVAQASLKKDQRLNIRISSRDLKNLQARALEEGVPYQTLSASLLHKYVSGHLISQR